MRTICSLKNHFGYYILVNLSLIDYDPNVMYFLKYPGKVVFL
jgi:hypothetical protein